MANPIEDQAAQELVNEHSDPTTGLVVIPTHLLTAAVELGRTVAANDPGFGRKFD